MTATGTSDATATAATGYYSCTAPTKASVTLTPLTALTAA